MGITESKYQDLMQVARWISDQIFIKRIRIILKRDIGTCAWVEITT